MQHWQQMDETVLCTGVKKCTSKKKGGKKTGLMFDGCAVASFLLDSLWFVMSVRPTVLSLMPCVAVI